MASRGPKEPEGEDGASGSPIPPILAICPSRGHHASGREWSTSPYQKDSYGDPEGREQGQGG